jgi:GNAT superfamily N-acetyltransferase
MAPSTVTIREATAADMPGISRVRLSVVENAATAEQLSQLGITNESVAASFLADSKGWVAEEDGRIVGFSIADRESGAMFALFVLPACEGRGIGSRLHDLALDWLWSNGLERAWLRTSPQTRAATFYARRGWVRTGPDVHGDDRYECSRFTPPAPTARTGR